MSRHMCSVWSARLSAPLRVVCLATCAASLLAWAGQEPVFRGGIDLVNLGVTVTDRRDQLVTGLAAEDFEVREAGQIQEIKYFAVGEADRGQAGPDLHLGLLLDVSESMGKDIGFTRTAAIRFLNTLADAVDVTVVDFDSEVRIARYGQRDRARLIERIRQQKATGMTALYDAIGVYLDGAAALDGRKIMLLYSDGGDTRSSLRWSELQTLLKVSDVTVYAIGELDHQSATSRGEARSVLRTIAEVTGGAAFFPSTVKDLDRIYERILSEIRAQYTIGYHSTNLAADGRWRKVHVTIAPGRGRDLQVRSRKGYFAPYKVQRKP